jgi:hypothetical protein
LAAAGLALSIAVLPAAAEDVEKKFRVSLAVGSYDTQDEVASPAANELRLLDPVSDTLLISLDDPRDDSATFNSLSIRPATRVTLAAQYALTKVFLIEGSIGYQEGDVGNIEVQAEFPRVFTPLEREFVFTPFLIPAGELTETPIQISGMARFRPRGKRNPYLGAGIGYIVVGFDPSPELNELSRRLDDSVGGPAPLVVSLDGGVNIVEEGLELGDLTGAAVDARDSFEWHLLGGAELSFKKKWSVFLDLRYVFASRTMRFGFNGADSVGVAVPQLTDDFQPGAPLPSGFGPFLITSGGLVDGGSLQPEVGSSFNPDTDDPTEFCAESPGQCEFVVGAQDGQLDTGLYYVQGGEIKYGGASLQVGIRYTF